MLALPLPVAQGVAASLDAAVPDGYTVRVVESGRGLLVDSAFAMTAGLCFVSVLTPFARRRAVRDCAEGAMSLVEDFVTDQEGGREWIDPGHLAVGGVTARAHVDGGALRMEFGCDGGVLARLADVALPAGWR